MGNHRLKKQELRFHDVRTLRHIQAVLGLLLIAAGALKLYAFAVADQEDDLAALFLAALYELEVFAGLWLLSGTHPEQARPWAIAIFTAFWAASLYEVVTGKCSCGCFGSLAVNPWFVLVFDTIAVAVLLKWHPPAGQARFFSSPPSMAGMAFTALLIGVAAVRQEALVSIAGTAQWRGQPLVDTALVVRGNCQEMQAQTDHDGAFRLPPVRPGLYTVSMTRSAALPEPRTETAGRGNAMMTAMERIQRQSQGGLAKKSALEKTRKPASELTKQYADREIVPLEVDECSATHIVVDFK